MISSKEIIDKLDEAFKMFGEYTYFDKGAEEIMDVDEIVKELKEMSNADILKVLKEVEANHKDSELLLSAITMGLINIEPGVDPKMDELAQDDFWNEYY